MPQRTLTNLDNMMALDTPLCFFRTRFSVACFRTYVEMFTQIGALSKHCQVQRENSDKKWKFINFEATITQKIIETNSTGKARFLFFQETFTSADKIFI